jgi:CBS domain-containing protein
VTIESTASIAAAAAKMCDQNVGLLAVLDRAQLVGVITDRDIVLRVLACGLDVRTSYVIDVMSRDVTVCFDDQRIECAAAKMGDHQVRRLPVLNRANRLSGILSVDRIAEHYSEHLAGEALGEIVEARSGRSLSELRR